MKTYSKLPLSYERVGARNEKLTTLVMQEIFGNAPDLTSESYLVKYQDVVAGIVSLYTECEKHCLINWLGVMDELGGHGIGHAALLDIIEHARSSGYETIALYNENGESAPATKLYKKVFGDDGMGSMTMDLA